jgi:carbamoyltransferase
MRVLGISAFYHDSAVALVDDGRIVFAAQEERYTRKKHDPRFPSSALRECLKSQNITLGDIDAIVFYEKPFIKFERLLETYLSFVPRGFKSFSLAMPIWIKEKLYQKKLISMELKKIDSSQDWTSKLRFTEHHQAHAASAFFPSPFDEAIVLTMDGVGEWTTSSISIGSGKNLILKKEMKFPHSLGLLYSAMTHFIGFKVNSGEYKVMGLAPYGEPRFHRKILDHLVDVKDDGSFALKISNFNFPVGLSMTDKRFEKIFGTPARTPEQELKQVHMDLAASIQSVTEEIVLKIVRAAVQEYGIRNLCLAGGVALNCVANGKILKAGLVDRIWIQPAAGDAGGSLGAALAYYYSQTTAHRATGRNHDEMNGSYLGQSYSDEEIESALKAVGAKFSRLEENELLQKVAKYLTEEKVFGWFQGRMEFGPRSLGARSIIADPRSPSMQKVLNLKIKFRESFRPFAPAVLREDLDKWFKLDVDSPYMTLVTDVLERHRIAPSADEEKLFGIDRLNRLRSSIPSITHIDYSARVQTVHQQTNSKFHRLISNFKDLTGCPILVNTSFNVRGEPIVNTPQDAFRCLMGTNMDGLVIGNYLVMASDQDPKLRSEYHQSISLD